MPILAITGWGEYPYALASDAKADLVLEKPFEMEELNHALEKVLFKIHAKGIRTKATQKTHER